VFSKWNYGHLLSNIILDQPKGVFLFCLARSQACCNGKGCKYSRYY